MKKVSVVVLVYYNEESLPLLFSELVEVEKQLGGQDLELELIFVERWIRRRLLEGTPEDQGAAGRVRRS